MLYLQIASPKSSVLNFLDSNSFEVIISIFQRTEKVPDMERLLMFEDWEDKYLFEVLSKKTSSLMWQKYEIVKVSQFVDYSEAQLEEIISLYPKLSRIVKTRLQEH